MHELQRRFSLIAVELETAVEVRAWVNNYSPWFYVEVITYDSWFSSSLEEKARENRFG